MRILQYLVSLGNLHFLKPMALRTSEWIALAVKYWLSIHRNWWLFDGLIIVLNSFPKVASTDRVCQAWKLMHFGLLPWIETIVVMVPKFWKAWHFSPPNQSKVISTFFKIDEYFTFTFLFHGDSLQGYLIFLSLLFTFPYQSTSGSDCLTICMGIADVSH